MSASASADLRRAAACTGRRRSVAEEAATHGGADNGPPGLRPEYSGRYYAAFVLDLDGNNVEAVFHSPE